MEGVPPQADVADVAALPAQLEQLQQLYGTRTVLLSTDDHTGEVLRTLQQEKGFNWIYLNYPRAQFRKRAWMVRRVAAAPVPTGYVGIQRISVVSIGLSMHMCMRHRGIAF